MLEGTVHINSVIPTVSNPNKAEDSIQSQRVADRDIVNAE